MEFHGNGHNNNERMKEKISKYGMAERPSIHVGIDFG